MMNSNFIKVYKILMQFLFILILKYTFIILGNILSYVALFVVVLIFLGYHFQIQSNEIKSSIVH